MIDFKSHFSNNVLSLILKNDTPLITLKRCSRAKCKRYFDVDLFKFNDKKKIYYKQCRSCQEKQMKHVMTHYNSNKENEEYKNKVKEYRQTYRSSDTYKQYVEDRKKDESVKEHKKLVDRQWRLNNPEKVKESSKACYRRYYEKNKDSTEYKQKRQEYKKIYNSKPETKAKRNERQRIRRREDPLCALRDNVSRRINKALKSMGTRKSTTTIKYLECSITFFKKHLEKQFTEGMSWENYGRRRNNTADQDEGDQKRYWEIDHITPIKYEDPTLEDVIERLHYTNCQPMWADENREKSNRFIGSILAELLDEYL